MKQAEQVESWVSTDDYLENALAAMLLTDYGWVAVVEGTLPWRADPRCDLPRPAQLLDEAAAEHETAAPDTPLEAEPTSA